MGNLSSVRLPALYNPSPPPLPSVNTAQMLKRNLLNGLLRQRGRVAVVREGAVSVTGASLRHGWFVRDIMRHGVRGQAVVDWTLREAVMTLLLRSLRRRRVVIRG